MPRRKQCPDCKKMFTWDDTQDGRKMFCPPCRKAFNAKKNRQRRSISPRYCDPNRDRFGYVPSVAPTPKTNRSQSIVRKTIDSKHWKRVKKLIEARDGPICMNHLRNGIAMAFSGQQLQLDHIIPQDVRPDLIWDLNNLEHLCLACHARKTKEESGLSSPCLHNGLHPLVVEWDWIPNLWAVSGHNPKRIEIFKEATGATRVLTVPQVEEMLSLRSQIGNDLKSGSRIGNDLERDRSRIGNDLANTMILCTRASQYEIGRRTQARFFQFLEGLNV